MYWGNKKRIVVLYQINTLLEIGTNIGKWNACPLSVQHCAWLCYTCSIPHEASAEKRCKSVDFTCYHVGCAFILYIWGVQRTWNSPRREMGELCMKWSSQKHSMQEHTAHIFKQTLLNDSFVFSLVAFLCIIVLMLLLYSIC